MATDLNRVMLVGRLTRDPEVKSTQSGTVFARFTLASNRTYRTKEETREEVGFFDCISWGKQAEVIAKYLSKGKRIGIDGFLRFSSWESDGRKNSKVEIQVDNFQFLDSKGAASSSGSGYADNSSSFDGMGDSASESGGPSMDDEIPF